MKIVVTGASGRIGRAIHFLLCQKHELVTLDRSVASSTSQLCDIGDYDHLAQLFEGADAVVHTAALHAPHVGVFTDQEFIKTNVNGTENVLRAAQSTGIRKIVFTSTTALYGYASQDERKAQWIAEDTVPLPKSVYHRTKLEAEAILEAFASDQMSITSLRMSRCFPEPAPTMALYRLHRGVDSRDVAQAHQLALHRTTPTYEKFIISGETPFSRSDCAHLKNDAPSVLREKCKDLCTKFDHRGWELPQSIDRVYDSSFAQSQLGWKPKHGYQSVLELLDSDSSETLPPDAKGTTISE